MNSALCSWEFIRRLSLERDGILSLTMFFLIKSQYIGGLYSDTIYLVVNLELFKFCSRIIVEMFWGDRSST